VSIRLQLLIVALTTLVLPWAGCQYARELETALRDAQESSLLASAGTMANALAAQPQRVFRDPDDTQPFTANRGDLYVYPLRNPPLLDGFREDWGIAADPTILPSASGYGARVQAGADDRYLYLYVEVEDSRFDAEPRDVHPEQDRFDRVDLTLQRPDGTREFYFFATSAPGLIAAQGIVNGADGRDHAVEEPRIQAFWRQSAAGYHVEARIPLSLVGSRLWVEALDGYGAGKAGVAAGNAQDGGRLFFQTPGLDILLGTFISGDTRATVIDANALILGTAGRLGRNDAGPDGARESWYRRWMGTNARTLPVLASVPGRLEGAAVDGALSGHPFAEWARREPEPAADFLLTAAAPIVIDGRVHGAVFLEQAGDQLLNLRDRAVTHLFNLTLLATAAAVVIMFGFATWISLRIGRLREAADTAVSADGSIRLDMPESGSGDELGALARGFERLLGRLNEHTQYLRTLGGKLSHELRTPLSIVRSSLDNLESEDLREDQRHYMRRAREGAQRLQSILSALGAAARVEESIKQAERVNIDLCELLSSAIAGYRDAFPGSRIVLEVPSNPCFVRGAPDLIVQMLDKLVENAVDFCSAGGIIGVRLERSAGSYVLEVWNDGPPIPESLRGRLFESMFEHRPGRDDKPHFGLGLYIVRLIAEFHGGTAVADNRSGGGGALFAITLPLI
jgi:two-component system, OmpR family, sensor histidine kinase ChvG